MNSPLKKWNWTMNKKAKKIAKTLRKIHRKGTLPEDEVMDALLGIQIEKVEDKIPLPELVRQYGVEHRIYQGDNPYFYIHRLFKKLEPYRPEKILDLGSGCGRVLFYGALLWKEVDFYGMEMIPQRVKATRKGIKKLGLDSVQCFQGDATKQKETLPVVDCICIMNSFFPYVLPKAMKRLKKYARKNPFLLVTVSTGNLFIAEQDWLEEVYFGAPAKDEFDFRFFWACA